MAKNGRTAAIIVGVGLVVGGIALLARKKVEIPLSAGWNKVTYTGRKQIAGVAFESISEYLVIAYYYDIFQDNWIQITYDTMLETDMALSIDVSQDCIWRY